MPARKKRGALASKPPKPEEDDGVVGSILRCAKPSAQPRPDEVSKTCEVAKSFLRLRFETLVRRAAALPLLIICLVDGTPIRAMKKVVAQTSTDIQITQSGKISTEFLVLRAFAVFVDSCGRRWTATLNRDPVGAHRKDGWTVYAIIEEFLPLARALGHTGALTVAYVLDGGVFGV